MGVVRAEQQPRLLLVADESTQILQKVPALQADAHIGYQTVNGLAVFLRQRQRLFHNGLLRIHLNDNAVRVPENLVPVFFQNIQDGGQVRTLGNGGNHISVVVEDRQPSAHTVGNLTHIIRIDLVVF